MPVIIGIGNFPGAQPLAGVGIAPTYGVHPAKEELFTSGILKRSWIQMEWFEGHIYLVPD